jgi:hypothetical protein
VNIMAPAQSKDNFEARAQGREAFWLGRPVWTNPLTGSDARAWTDGWKRALGDLSARRGLVLSASAAEKAEWQAMLALYRPADVTPPPTRRPRSSQQPKAISPRL